MNKRLLSLLLLVLVVMMPVNLWAQDEGGTTLKSNVYVGGDISMLPKYEEAEVEYKDSLGNTVNDVIAFFKQEGLNAMRVRLFVDPTKATDNEQKQGVCQDLNYVIALGKRIKDAGLSFLLDFHYSDTWADPGRQWTPDAWKTLDDDALAIQLYTYTKECLQQLKNAGAIPDMIQTGNEISYGMLWGVSGTTDNRCYTNSDNANWLRFFNLLGQTTKACREECPNAKIILHNERVNNISTLTDFYDRMQSANIDYDIIGLSYYPEFHGNLATLEEAISALEAKNYGKSIMLVETGYSYAWSITDGVKYDYTSTYPFTEEGQRQFTADLITMLNQHSSITGLFWWWPEDNGNKMVTSYWWNAGLYNHETGQPYAAFYELKNFVGNSPGFEPYAVLTTDTTSVLSSDSTGVTYGKTLTFYYDDQKEVRNGMSVGPFSYGQAGQAWYDSSGSITKAVFDASFANCTSLTSTAWWFYQCRKLSQIEGIENLKTDNVTNMSSMFYGCSGLTNLDVSNFKTDNVTAMSWMFYDCSKLTNLDVSNFKTDNVTDIYAMFRNCSALTNLDVSNFKTDNVTDMYAMFRNCSALTNLDVSNFNTQNVTSMSDMFNSCSSLTSLDVSNFKTDNVTDMGRMFDGCSGLTTLDVSNFKTDNVTDMGAMFSGCSGLTALDVSSFNTDNVTNMMDMFSGCSGLTALDVSSCFNTGNVTNMSWMFGNCSCLTSLDVSGFNTENVTNMSSMFGNCSSLTTIYAGSGWSTEAVTNGGNMFTDCVNLVGGAGTAYDSNHIDHTYAHIDGGASNPGYFTAKSQETDNTFSTCAEVGAGEDGKTYRVKGRVKSISNTTFGNWYIEDATDSLYIYGTVDYVGRYPRDGMSWESYGINVGDTVTVQGPKSTYKGVPELVDVRVLSPITLLNVSSNDTAMIAMINRESIRLAPNAATVTAKLYYAGSNCEVTIPDHAQSWLTLQSIEANNGDAEAIFSISDNITTGKRGAEVLFKTSNDSIVYETALFISQNELELSPYAVLTTDSTTILSQDSIGVTYGQTLTFYYDDKKTERNGMSVGPFTETYDSGQERWNIDSGWDEKRENITTVVFDDSFANCTTLTSTAYWFYECNKLTAISGIEYLKTDNVTDMFGMFSDCSGLTSLDVSNFKTDNVTNMGYLFSGCSSLTSLDVSGFNTSKVTNMYYLFSGCSGLTSLDVSNFNTVNVADMGYMFQGCSGLTSLDVSNFKTDNVNNMGYMFSNCSGLTSLDVSGFNTSNVIFMHSLFSGCSNLTSLDVSNFKTDNVTRMSFMFSQCSGLTSLDVSSFNTKNVTNMGAMFQYCSSLTNLDVSGFNTANVTYMNQMFTRCSSLSSLDLSSFNTANVTAMANMFYRCYSLTTIYAGSGWNTANISENSSGSMFKDCTNLVGGAGTVYDANHIDYTYAHIDGGTSNPGYFTDIESVRRWDFTKWSSETIANLKADAAASKTTGWSDVEKKADAEAGAEPTEAAKDNCFWLDAETTEANGVAIAELEGLVFNKSYCSSRKLAIAVNYPSTSLGDYAGGAYLWLGDKGRDCFTIPNVKNGQTITIELESHKTSEGRGITLIAGSTELDSFTTMTKASYSWTIPEDCDVVVRNTNGCHIYTITVSGEGTPTDTLEIYAVETGSTITPNQPIMATQSVIVTPGNDVEWLTNMSMGSAWVNPLDFTSNIYYPGSTTTYTFEGSMRGTNNPKDGDIEDGVSTGNGYKPYQKNYPKSGGFLTFEVQQEGSLIVPIRVFAGKPLYVTDKTGTAKKDIQFKDASGQTLALQTNPLCAVSADEDVTGFVSFNVQPGEKYYVFSVGSKARFGGYVFSKQAIDIDPATMANVIDSLDALPTTLEPYAVLTTDTTSVLSSDSTGVTYGKTLTFYYDDQKAERNGMNIGPFESSSERGWNSNADSITVVVFDDSFANCTTLTSTALWFSGCRNLKTIVGIENLKTDHVTTMFAMFDCCNSLTSLDVSKFNTENVTRMNDMFSDCRSLTSLDVTNFNTAKVTDMCDMFINCSSLTSLDVSNFKTDSVTNMSFMFIECSGLTSLDLSNFNTAKVTDMSKMFALCSGLTTIYVGNEWTTASVTDGTDMFKGCSAIKGGKGTTYSETFTIAYGNSTSSDYARIDYKGMPGYFTPKYGYTPEPTYTLEGNVLTIKAPIESSVYYVITDLYSGIDFESGDSLRIPETLYTGPLTLDHPVRVRFMAVNGRIAHSEIIVVKYKPIEATFDGRVLAVGGSTTMTDALESVGGRDEVAKTITAIVWNSTATLSNSDLQGLDNPNLLIYVNERSQAPQNRNNVVVNGLAMNVVLSDTGSGNCDFYAPQTFTAEMITYSREFKQATQVGVCRGWETISLPFMVQTITHADNGVVTPFGVDTSNKHFWLRQLSTNGLVSATKIEANVPYLISMPNDEKNYAKEYILKGLVTFSAENAVVPKTEPTALALADSSLVMMPALQSVGKSSTVWALNVGQERSQYFEGSTFERDYREVRPFEAYTIHRSDTPAPRFLPINDLMNSATGIETISNVIMSHDNFYHIDGRKVDGKPTKKGLYITNGRKVVIK